MSTLNNWVEGVASPLRQLQRMDDRRPSLPGEHWATLGTGLTVLGWARSRRSPLLRTAGSVAGLALLLRAATGRDGLLTRFRRR